MSAHMNPLAEATLLERSVLDEGMRQMRSWTPEEIIEILEEAATILVTLRADVWCDWCDGPVTECDGPVRNDEEVSWRGAQARVWCCTNCQTARYEAEINAAGNEAS